VNTLQDLVTDGQDILAALTARGVTVTLDAERRPRVRPRALVDEATMAILSAHREAVVAALVVAKMESWRAPCSVCGSRGTCQQQTAQPDGGWACQESLSTGLIRDRREPEPAVRGAVLRVVSVVDQGRRNWHVAWQVVDLEGQPLGLGLFASRQLAVEWIERHGGRLVGGAESEANGDERSRTEAKE